MRRLYANSLDHFDEWVDRYAAKGHPDSLTKFSSPKGKKTLEISQERGQTSRELRRHSQKIKLFREKLIFAVEFGGGLGRDERERERENLL